MDPDIYRLVGLIILFLFFTVAVTTIGVPAGLPAAAGTPAELADSDQLPSDAEKGASR